ncbi:MAG: PVC-type heme-binding CxxCH protein, partial [Planctomycetaceae bacterium]
MKVAPRNTFAVGVLLLVAGGRCIAAAPANVGVQVPAGFEVTLYADDHLAHDIYAMTVDSKGRVVVSGRGYVRILLDTDGDGQADAFKQFADGPRTGAQGLYFYGRDLICTGDAGLLRYRDRNGDDRADGPPDVFLRMKTGGEHHSHAVRKGPDGWWYLIAGNFAGITSQYVTRPTSPVRNPAGGTLLRLRPDLSGGEVYCDGFRNPYDFAFNAQGDVFTYDSDGERAVSLPWYRPTRVFQGLPGSHAGWVTRSWKRPRTYADMPPVLGAFGRGSPTGVACYRHGQFPAKYRNAVFALDWTFGRVLALPLKRNGSTWKSAPATFMTGTGEYGFAPTDVAVGPDGSLFVSVGGRGTRGGVFRVRYVGEKRAAVKRGSDLWECLNAPQPLSSWSRAKWMPLARKLGAAPFRKAAVDALRPESHRIRAIEILTEMYGGLNPAEVLKLLKAKSPDLRARAIWSHGRMHAARPNTLLVRPFLADEHPAVRRAALEALSGADGSKTDFESVVSLLAKRLGDDDRFVRQLAMHVVRRLSAEDAARLRERVRFGGRKGLLAFELGRLERARRVDLKSFGDAVAVFGRSTSADLRRDALRVMQLALGGCGPRDKRPAVFDGYAGRLDLKPHERALDP